jgi:uncharacterized protein (TIGR02646 family)
MRQIRKLLEPRSLTEHRATPRSDYASYRDKQTLREQLVREQLGLCCYCLSRISSGEPGMPTPMKIAHWHSQDLHEDEQLDYSNLLGACKGNERHPPDQQHCDTRQGNRDIKFNPANPDHRIDQRVRYLEDGTIISDDEEFNEQIKSVLNLNAKFLQQRRREKLQIFLESLGTKELKRQEQERLLADWNGDSHNRELEPYCQIVICWLRRRLARA